MNAPLHRDLAAGRWWQLSLADQLGNVGSELSRANKWKLRDPKIARGALERLLELMDLTLADPRHLRSVARLREIARTREALVDFLAGSNQYRSTGPALQRYFDAYAVAAHRSRRGAGASPPPDPLGPVDSPAPPNPPRAADPPPPADSSSAA